jgi:hypothetical protein
MRTMKNCSKMRKKKKKRMNKTRQKMKNTRRRRRKNKKKRKSKRNSGRSLQPSRLPAGIDPRGMRHTLPQMCFGKDTGYEYRCFQIQPMTTDTCL